MLVLEPPTVETSAPVRRSAEAPRTWLDNSVVRFIAAGVTGNIVYALIFVALRSGLSLWGVAANVAATIVSTVLVSELHRRFTFRAAPGAGMCAQGTGATMALVGLGASSIAVAIWEHAVPGASSVKTLAVVYATGAVVGAANFVVMRWRLAARPRSGRGVSHPASDRRSATPARALPAPPGTTERTSPRLSLSPAR